MMIRVALMALFMAGRPCFSADTGLPVLPDKKLPEISVGRSTVPAITAESLVIKSSRILELRDKLSDREAEYDIRLLAYALKHGYVGSRMGNTDAVAQALRSLDALSSRLDGNYSSVRLCRELTAILHRIPDRQLQVSMFTSSCGTARQFPPEQGRTGPNFIEGQKREWDISSVITAAGDVPVVSLTSFPPMESPLWYGYLKSLKTALSAAPAVIIDVRGNRGDNLFFAAKTAAALYGTQDNVPSPQKNLVRMSTPETAAMCDINAVRLSAYMPYLLKGLKIPPELAVNLEQKLRLNDEVFNRMRQSGGNMIVSSLPEVKPGKGMFSRPIVILTDRRCSYACERFLEFMEAHPEAVTIGENTYGGVHYENAGGIILPASHILVSIPVDYRFFRDTRSVETFGYPPRIHAEGKDALGEAMKYLEHIFAGKQQTRQGIRQ